MDFTNIAPEAAARMVTHGIYRALFTRVGESNRLPAVADGFYVDAIEYPILGIKHVRAILAGMGLPNNLALVNSVRHLEEAAYFERTNPALGKNLGLIPT